MTPLNLHRLPFALLAQWAGLVRDGLLLAALLIPRTSGGKQTTGERRSDA